MSPRGRVQFWAALLGILTVLVVATVLLRQRTIPEGAGVALASPGESAVAAAPVTPAVVTEPAVDPTITPTDPEQTRPVAVATPPENSAGLNASESAQSAIPVAPEPIDQPTSAPLPTVPVHQARVRVELGDDDRASDVRDAVLALDGVVDVTEVIVTERTLGGVPARIAQVDLDTFRSFTPQSTANHQPLWDRIAAGDIAVTHEFGTNHDVPLGARLATDVDTILGEPRTLRVGAFATNGTPPIADAIVLAGTLPADGIRVLYVALEEQGSPGATVDALSDLGYQAEEIVDPRIPRSETIMPVEGINADNVWDHLALCESSGDWHINTGNGYYGGIQFLPESWAWVGGQGLPHEHSREEQIYRGTLLWQIQGWEAWPQCARRLGLIVDQPPGPTPQPSRSVDSVEVQES